MECAPGSKNIFLGCAPKSTNTVYECSRQHKYQWIVLPGAQILLHCAPKGTNILLPGAQILLLCCTHVCMYIVRVRTCVYVGTLVCMIVRV